MEKFAPNQPMLLAGLLEELPGYNDNLLPTISHFYNLLPGDCPVVDSAPSFGPAELYGK